MSDQDNFKLSPLVRAVSDLQMSLLAFGGNYPLRDMPLASISLSEETFNLLKLRVPPGPYDRFADNDTIVICGIELVAFKKKTNLAFQKTNPENNSEAQS